MATTKKSTATVATTKKALPSRKAKQDVKPEQKQVIDTKNLKDTVKTAVISQREVKWKYPEDVNGPLERKAWRRVKRDAIKSLESKIFNTKEEKDKAKLSKELQALRKEVLMVP